MTEPAHTPTRRPNLWLKLAESFVHGVETVIAICVLTLPYGAYRAWELLDQVAEFRGRCPGLMDVAPYDCNVAEYVARASHGIGFAAVVFDWVPWAAVTGSLWLGWRWVLRRLERAKSRR